MTDLPAPQPGTQIAAPDPAPAPKTRRRWLVPVIISAGIVVLLGAGAGIGYAVVAGQRTPEAVVSSYLNELVAGDAALDAQDHPIGQRGRRFGQQPVHHIRSMFAERI